MQPKAGPAGLPSPSALSALAIVDSHSQNVHMAPDKNFVPQSIKPALELKPWRVQVGIWRIWRNNRGKVYSTNPCVITFCVLWEEGISESGRDSWHGIMWGLARTHRLSAPRWVCFADFHRWVCFAAPSLPGPSGLEPAPREPSWRFAVPARLSLPPSAPSGFGRSIASLLDFIECLCNIL